jgi:signal transduction histidine kinase
VIDRAGALATVDLRVAMLRDHERQRAVVRVIENVHRQDNAKALKDLRERAHNLAVSNRELESFASVVAHDLRAPLRHVSQFSEFLALELGEAASAAAREQLTFIRSSAGKMSVMIERLLEYARIGVGAPALGPVDLAACFEEARELLGAEAAAADVKASFGKGLWVRGDRVLVTRLLQNLLQNALKFRKPAQRPKVRVKAAVEGQHIVVSFEDDGLGVDPEKADLIFEMFKRGHEGSDIAGHGIGLAFCRRICETLGGSIALDPSKPDGARFVIEMTRAKPKPKRTRPR